MEQAVHHMIRVAEISYGAHAQQPGQVSERHQHLCEGHGGLFSCLENCNVLHRLVFVTWQKCEWTAGIKYFILLVCKHHCCYLTFAHLYVLNVWQST